MLIAPVKVTVTEMGTCVDVRVTHGGQLGSYRGGGRRLLGPWLAELDSQSRSTGPILGVDEQNDLCEVGDRTLEVR